MKDRAARPVIGLSVPAGAPAPVTEAHETYRRLTGELRAARDEHRRLQAAAVTARESGLREFAELAIAGKGSLPDDPAEAAREAQHEADAARDRVEALAVAVDQAGDELLRTIDEAREAWIADNAEQAAELRDRYEQALAEVRALLASLSESWQTADWLERRGQFAASRGEHGLSYQPPRRDFVRLRPGEAPTPIADVVAALEAVYPI